MTFQDLNKTVLSRVTRLNVEANLGRVGCVALNNTVRYIYGSWEELSSFLKSLEHTSQ